MFRRRFQKLLKQQALNDQEKLMKLQAEENNLPPTQEAAIKDEKQSITIKADQIMEEIISMSNGERIKLLEMLYYKHFDKGGLGKKYKLRNSMMIGDGNLS